MNVTQYRVKHFLSRLGEDRYCVECSVNGKPWHTIHGPAGRTRAFHTLKAATEAMKVRRYQDTTAAAKATGDA